jgi:hypothetical protein
VPSTLAKLQLDETVRCKENSPVVVVWCAVHV